MFAQFKEQYHFVLEETLVVFISVKCAQYSSLWLVWGKEEDEKQDDGSGMSKKNLQESWSLYLQVMTVL